MAQCECTPWNSRRCEEPALAGQSRCILHDANSAKDAAEFLTTLKDKVEREEQDDVAIKVNLADVVFPPGFCWRDVRRAGDAFPKRVSFVRAVFTGTADFEGAQFAERCDFGHAMFTGTAHFQDAIFTGNAGFWNATFNGAANFWRATFSKAAHFGDVKFGGSVTFVSTTFAGDATFMGATFTEVASFAGVTFKELANFWGSTFNAGAEFSDDTTFGGAAQFRGAKFRGIARFTDTKFTRVADFTRSSFSGEVWFLRAMFAGAADFIGAAFAQDKEVSFARATFRDELRFRDEPELKRKPFPTQEASGAVDFTDVTLEKSERVYFQDVNLSRVSFLGTDLRQVRFLNTTWAKLPKRPRPSPRWWPFTTARTVWSKRARWPWRWPLVLMTALWRRRPMWLLRWPRWWPTWLRPRALNVLYDDPRVSGGGIPEKGDYEQAAELYRQLRVNLEENRQHIEAGDFYVGQMDMRLRDSRLSRLHRGLLWLYGWAVLYGESFLRPLALYGITALLFGLGYLWAGFQWSPRTVHRPDFVIVAVADGDFWKDYAEAVVLALRAGPIPVAEPQPVSRWMLPLRYMNTLLNVLWLALAVIALRRAFRR